MPVTTFPPIADYAFLSNCEQSCLVAPDGTVEWLCLPRPDSPSVFGALLDRTAGGFRFGPTNAEVPVQRVYVPGTMVLETTWHTSGGWLVVHDLLVMGRAEVDHRRGHYRRAPADFGAAGVLLRTATCISGRVEVMVDCAPLLGYGTVEGTWSYQGGGYESMTVAPKEGDLRLDVAGNIPLGTLGVRSYGRTTLAAGESAYVTLSWGGGSLPATWEEAAAARDGTTGYWRDWLSPARLPDHPWRPYLERSALTLKGLSYAPTGAIMAASTTSLPETPGGARNWDYRYTWIRDSAFMLRALYRLGFRWEAIDYFGSSSMPSAAAIPASPTCRSCTASAANASSPSGHSITCPDTGAPARSGLATARGTSASTTSGECCWTRSISNSGATPPRSQDRCGRA